MTRERVNLSLVEMRDWLDVGRAVAVLDEKPLIVLEPVRCANHSVVEPISMEILHSLADALLEVGCRDDLQVLLDRQPLLEHPAVRGLYHKLEMIQSPIETATDRLESRADILLAILDPELLGDAVTERTARG